MVRNVALSKAEVRNHKGAETNVADLNSFMHIHCSVSSYATLKFEMHTKYRLHVLCCSGPFKSASSTEKTV